MGKVTLRIPPPNEKQELAFRERHRYVGYGGARGGGKSWFVRWKAVLLCLHFPGIKVLITRKTYKELDNNHIQPLKQLLSGIAGYNKSDKRFTFPNGSTISFGYCATEGDLGQYQGAEYDVWFADEAGQFLESWLTNIDACVRGVNGFPKRTYYTLNPGGPSHGYFKRLFIDRRYTEDEHPEDYAFIQALVTDNKALMRQQPEYIRSLEKLPPKLKEAWLHGRWDIFEGQFFEDFRIDPDLDLCREAGVEPEEARKQRRFVHVIQAFRPPQGWSIWRSYDFGYGKPFSCAWWAIDYDGVLYRILELYGCTNVPNEGLKWSPDQQFKRIAEVERTHPYLVGKRIQGVADPAIWDASRGESIAETGMKYGIYFEPGDNERIPGWMQVHYRFQFDENGYPRMYIFDSCKGFIRTIPTLMYDDHKPEDLDTEGEDHIADETRYMCMARPIKPVMEVSKEPIYNDPLNQISENRRNTWY